MEGPCVYVGGNFTSINGISAYAHIAYWNSLTGTWFSLGSGLNFTANTITIEGPNVYVGGIFTDAGGIQDGDKIARWDGSKWNAVGGGTGDNQVDAILVSGPSPLGSFPILWRRLTAEAVDDPQQLAIIDQSALPQISESLHRLHGRPGQGGIIPHAYLCSADGNVGIRPHLAVDQRPPADRQPASSRTMANSTCWRCSRCLKTASPALSAVVRVVLSGSARKCSGSATPAAIIFLMAMPSCEASKLSSSGDNTDQLSLSSVTRMEPGGGGLPFRAAWRALRSASEVKRALTWNRKVWRKRFRRARSSSHWV